MFNWQLSLLDCIMHYGVLIVLQPCVWWQKVLSLCCAGKQKFGEDDLAASFEPTELSGVTLADLIPKSLEVGFKEADMQPVVIDLIQEVMQAVACDCHLLDTHLSSNQLEEPTNRPGCALVAAGDRAAWTQVVSIWDFKTGTGKQEMETMYGQQVKRCRAVLNSYKQRQLVVAVSVTMNTLEIMTAEPQPLEGLRLRTTGRHPFSISTASSGFQLLVQLLTTPKAQLGFITASLPSINRMGRHCFKVEYLLNQGSSHQDSVSWVFRVKLEAGGNAILKLSSSLLEVNQPPLTMHTVARVTSIMLSACCVPSTSTHYSMYMSSPSPHCTAHHV